MLTVAEAERIILEAVAPAAVVELPLEDAYGSVLREPINADRPFPPYDRVAMDGVALALKTWERGVRAFPVAGIQRAGEPACILRDPTHCLEVMTGAVMPVGCDCVVPVEQITRANDVATLAADVTPGPMQHVHRLGSDRPAGAELLSIGTLLYGPQIAVCATAGRARVRVADSPGIAVISTGDELVPVAATPLPHQIRRSNGSAIRAGLAAAGFRKISGAHEPDDPAALEAILSQRLRDCSFMILTGGVSEGRFDHVPGVLRRLGVQEHLHKVAQKPGKPLWFGVGPQGQAVFGLPGNPVSALVCFHRYVLPALWRHLGAGLLGSGERPRAVLTEAIKCRKPMTLFQPVRVCEDGSGLRRATPVPMNGSGDLAGLAASDGVIELPDGGRTFAVGEAHPIWLWSDPFGMVKHSA